MFTVAKVIRANPKHRSFLTTNIFVFDEEWKSLSVIMVLADRKELLRTTLLGCGPGPETFEEVLRELRKGLEGAPDKTRLIYKEQIRDIKDVDDFAVEHFWPYIDRISVMGTHEDIAEIVRKCFPQAMTS